MHKQAAAVATRQAEDLQGRLAAANDAIKVRLAWTGTHPASLNLVARATIIHIQSSAIRRSAANSINRRHRRPRSPGVSECWEKY